MVHQNANAQTSPNETFKNNIQLYDISQLYSE